MRPSPVATAVLAGLTAFLGFIALATAAALPPHPNKTCADPGVVCPDPLFHNGFDGLDPDGDEDGDGLPNRVETNTGVYVSANDTGTDPYNRDTDGDGLSDGDEVLPTPAGLDLAAMGVNPVHKDLLIEYDWMDDAIGGVPHSHKPTQAELDGVAAVFASAPVTNPDGRPGIHVIQDVGQGFPFTGGGLITDHSAVVDGGAPGTDYESILIRHMNINRLTRFHYMLMAHSMEGTDSSGSAEIGGFRAMTALSIYSAHQDWVRNAILHELGHNFGLLHGGDVSCTGSPDYPSLMNYRYTFSGVPASCAIAGAGIPDYSSGFEQALDEHHLNEYLGVCGAGHPIDWNGSGGYTTDVTVDLNAQWDNTCEGGSTLGMLHDFNDWAGIRLPAVAQSVYPWGVDVAKRSRAPSEICPSPPPHRTAHPVGGTP